MAKLLILADDFTGALDTGVQFAAKGASTLVVTKPDYDFSTMPEQTSVVVFDTETRHVSPDAAYKTVYHAALGAKKAGIEHFYKKTDSALRGNIGPELTALVDATGASRLHFVPAFPRMGRVTKQGIHYINDVPVAKSVFSHDPFNPVTCSDILKMVSEQSSCKVSGISKYVFPPQKDGISVYDASTDDDLKEIADGLAQSGELDFLAGCAGFASMLPSLLNLEGSAPSIGKLPQRLMVVCGSVNPITIAQLDEAEKSGVPRLRLLPEQKLNPSWVSSTEAADALKSWEKKCRENEICILDTNNPFSPVSTEKYAASLNLTPEETRAQISRSIGGMVKWILEQGLESTLLVTGGDTLLEVMKQIGLEQIVPVGELEPGVVLSYFSFQGKEYPILSKSGGFGSKTLILDLMKKIRENAAGKDY